MVKDSVLNEEIRRKTQGSSFQYEIQKCGVSLLSQNRAYRSIVSCGKRRTKAKRDDDDNDDRVTIATCDDLIILRDFKSVNLVSDESIDATLHVTPMKEFFTSYISGDFGVLKMGNGVTKVIDVGDVCLQTNTRM
ncbi:hypothetical protein CR513_54417, partial [Mucuna pruriens]